MELLELISSIIPWIIGIAIALVVGFVSLLFTLPWIGFNQFDGVDVEDIEETTPEKPTEISKEDS